MGRHLLHKIYRYFFPNIIRQHILYQIKNVGWVGIQIISRDDIEYLYYRVNWVALNRLKIDEAHFLGNRERVTSTLNFIKNGDFSKLNPIDTCIKRLSGYAPQFNPKEKVIKRIEIIKYQNGEVLFELYICGEPENYYALINFSDSQLGNVKKITLGEAEQILEEVASIKRGG